eukprot:74023-Pyramimonas_sp.AAC.1
MGGDPDGGDVVPVAREIVAVGDDVPAGQPVAPTPTQRPLGAGTVPASGPLADADMDDVRVAHVMALLFEGETAGDMGMVDVTDNLEDLLPEEFKKAGLAISPPDQTDGNAGEFDHVPSEERDYNLEDCAAHNFKFLTESAMGRRWVRYLAKQKEKKQEYDAMTRAQKEDERAAWATIQFQ